MARIPLSNGFTLIPEGMHVFKITKVEYDETFGKLLVNMETSNGSKHIERFSLLDKNGEPNSSAFNAFSYFARNALNDFSSNDVDPDELVGRYIEAEVTHTELPSRRDPDKTMKFVKLGDKFPADGFEDVTQADSKSDEPKPPVASDSFDLDSLLD